MNRRALLMVIACSGAAAAQGALPSAAALLTKPIAYYNPDWSPDGRAVVFESTLAGVYSIYSINADGSGLRRLTADSANNEQASWSHDGRRIVFSSDRAGHSDLYLMNADGSGQRRVTTTNSGGYYGATFSPDGRLIAFQGRPDNAETRDRVYVVGSDGTGMRQLTDSSYGAEGPQWSADGQSITFSRVPYPKARWSEMGPGDVASAKAGEQLMSIGVGGGALRAASAAARAARTAAQRVGDARVGDDARPSPDSRHFTYTRVVDGWSGLYSYDVASRSERLLTGGAGAGPLGYLRIATLTTGTDTIDTFGSLHNATIERGNGAWVVHTVRPAGARRFEVTDVWYDSAGHVTARQSFRTMRGSIATELETVRATMDSASMLVVADRVTGWVVPGGKQAQLFDGAGIGERYAGAAVAAAVARAKPAAGQLFVAPMYSLYGGNPIAVRVDSFRVTRRDTLYRGQTPLPVVVVQNSSGGERWLDETTGDELLSRGNAGPDRWWWHIRRGVAPPRQSSGR